MQCAELRQVFLTYFQSLDHQAVSSSSLIPQDDPTLLFTNAGMVPFKDHFLGLTAPPAARVTSVQRCVRAGGKHNDLDNVGYTARHHTFFEMLGNFSFGDYFKRDAIRWAWAFLTDELQLPPERLWVTVYQADDEAAAIWLDEMKVSPERFSRCGKEDNFWSMGEIGPCGPCSEIFYDHGAHIPGGPPGSPDADLDRYVEIWNLVFMQYERAKDGCLSLLPKPAVDTGMGFERLAAVLQGVHDNYQIDLFQQLMRAVTAQLSIEFSDQPSVRVVADHLRSTAFLIADGVIPSHEGRGYVLRRIIRRACRHGNKLGATEPFFYQLVPALVKEMGDAYPLIRTQQALIEQLLLKEEEQFMQTLSQGLIMLEKEIGSLATGATIGGELVFRLYDTYGFPLDLTQDIARERHLTVDHQGFAKAMDAQRKRSQQSNHFESTHWGFQGTPETTFIGYDTLQDQTTILGLGTATGEVVNQLKTDRLGVVVLNKTPFYAESGGQVGDCGSLETKTATFKITDTKKQGPWILHYGQLLEGQLQVDDAVTMQVDPALRRAIACNHSATHLLHAALQQLLGRSVQQKGSLVTSQKLRFDFSYDNPLSSEQLVAIEQLVNEKITDNLPVETLSMSVDEALASGAQALFGEKYNDTVRVLSMGDFSKELCGGTHVTRTGDIGVFKITLETSVAAGIRRIEAVTYQQALVHWQTSDALLLKIAKTLKTDQTQLMSVVERFMQQQRDQEKTITRLQHQANSTIQSQLLHEAKIIAGITVLSTQVPSCEPSVLHELLDQLKKQLKRSVILLATIQANKITLVSSVTDQQTRLISAGHLVNYVAKQIGGKGGGRVNRAQGGGTQLDALPDALASVYRWVEEQIACH